MQNKLLYLLMRAKIERIINHVRRFPDDDQAKDRIASLYELCGMNPAAVTF